MCLRSRRRCHRCEEEAEAGRRSRRACPRSRRRSEEEDGVTGEEGLPEAGTVRQQENPRCETIVQMTTSARDGCAFITGVIT